MKLHHGDCLDVMAGMEPESVDAVVTDPPYSFPGGFMGRAWDRFVGEDIDPAFLHWFAGFVDGEGCFSVHRKPQATYDCQFSISLRADDRPILERIHRTLAMGTLSNESAHRTGNGHPKVRWSVSSKGDCVRLRDVFRNFPLRAKKAHDFEEWSEALDAWLTHQTGEWQDMAASRDRLMRGRDFTPEGVRVDPYQMWTIRWARQAFRVLKPGGWLIASGAPKRVHRMTAGLEDAGFEIRDMLLHCFASGFPKGRANLKPAYEPWVLARKPGPLRELAIDACRIGTEPWSKRDGESGSGFRAGKFMGAIGIGEPTQANGERASGAGRWPANVILTETPDGGGIFDGGWDGVVGGGEAASGGNINGRPVTGYSKGWADERWFEGYQDSGTYSRFFLIPKADRADREPSIVEVAATATRGGRDGLVYTRARQNTHPTVKSTDLMRHLVRLVTPTGGLVLDPFAGSGSTLLAAEMEGFEWIGIEKEREYIAIAEARLNGTQRGLGLPA